jgi:hypothetical protein
VYIAWDGKCLIRDDPFSHINLTQIAKFSFALILVNLIAKIGVWNHVMYSYLVFTWFHFAGYKYSWSVAVVHHHLNIVPISSYTDDFLELVSLAMKGVCLGFTCSQCRPKLCHWLPYFMKQYLEILMYFFPYLENP